MATAGSSPVQPRAFQFTLGSLLAAMVGIGLISVAVARPTVFWAGATFFLTLLALLAGVLVVIYRTDRTRAFAIGYLIFNFGFLLCLVLVAGSLGGALRGNWTPVSGAWTWLFETLHPPQAVQQPESAGPLSGSMGPGGAGGMPGGEGGIGPTPGMPGDGGMMDPFGRGLPGPMGGGGTYWDQPYADEDFAQICNLGASCLIGALGGILAQWLCATLRSESPSR